MILMFGCANEFLKPTDFLMTPSIIDPKKEFGHLKTETVVVPASRDIFLAGAEDGTVLPSPYGGLVDRAPDHCPVAVLEDVIVGGETLDIYASGEAKDPQRVPFGPKGLIIQNTVFTIVAGPALRYKAVTGPFGALVGVFDNQREPFVIGQRKQILVPRGARILHLAVLDFPGASSDNEGEYSVTIEIIRR